MGVTAEWLAEQLREPELHAAITGGVKDIAYSLGVVTHAGQPALLLHVPEVSQVPAQDSVQIEGETVALLIQGGFAIPRSQSRRAAQLARLKAKSEQSGITFADIIDHVDHANGEKE